MNKDIELLMSDINGKYLKSAGGPVIQIASDVTNTYLLKRPTGIASIDIQIGGGFPAGTFCQIAAPDGVGKNALCNQIVSMVQKTYQEDSRIAWICTEMTFDKLFAHMFDVVVPLSQTEIDIINKAQVEKGLPPLGKSEEKFRKKKLGEFLIVDRGSSAQKLEVALRLIESNKFQVVVIDSMTAILPEVQDETDLEDEPQQSSEARLITRFCQKYWGKARISYDPKEKANWTTVLATYQVRGNRSQAKFKKAWAIGGAYALRHAKAIDLQMENGDRYPAKSDSVQLGKKMKFTVKKGKAGCHEGGKGEVLYLYDEGFDRWKDLIKQARDRDILKQAGKYWKWVDYDGKEVQTFTGGADGIIAELVKDDNKYWALYKDVTKAAGIECVFKLW